MRSYINLTTLLLLLFSIPSALCLVELPSFPRAPEELEKSHNQFIVQFESTKDREETKQIILLGMNDDINVVKEIPSRNIGVLKFPSAESAETWRKNNSKNIKYFQEGEKIIYYFRPSEHKMSLTNQHCSIKTLSCTSTDYLCMTNRKFRWQKLLLTVLSMLTP